MGIKNFLEKKGIEYAPFDPNRAKNIYKKLIPHIKQPFKAIHIVGTNGKGSTGRFITLGLLQAQKKVLHFTSPHLFEFTERFYKNGKIIDEYSLEQAHIFLQQFEFISECSYFEYATFLALVLSQDVDFLILEAGVGGEYDSTSVVPREISVFTPIGLDHQEMLGDTLEAITRTKINSIAPNAFLSFQPSDIIKSIAQKIAKEKKSNLFFIDENLPEDILKYTYQYDMPKFLAHNLHTALEVLKFINIPIEMNNFPKLDLIGRCQKICSNITIDVGHNENAAKELANVFKNKQVILVYNTYKEKDIFSILKTLKPIIKQILIIEVSNPRIIEETKLKDIINTFKIASEKFSYDKLSEKEEYLVFGSFSVVEKFLEDFNAR